MSALDWTAKALRTVELPPGQTKLSLPDSKTKNLYFEVRRKSRAFIYRIRRNGCVVSKTIGQFPEVSIEEARQEAKRLRKQDMTDLRQTSPTPTSSPTVDRFVADYFAPYSRQRHKEWAANMGVYRNHIRPTFGTVRLSAITKSVVHKWTNELAERGLKNATINRIIILFGQILGLAERLEITGAPQRQKLGLKTIPVKLTHNVYLSPDEVHRLSEAVHESTNPDLNDIVSLLLLTGARRGEVLQMRWTEIDAELRFWTVPKSKNGRPRQIQLPPSAKTLITRRHSESSGSPYVFPSPVTGLPYKSIHYCWNVARRKAGLPNLRIHDLRHSYASALVNVGVPLYDVQHLLGHSSIKTTQRYAHLSTERLRDSVRRIEDVYGKQA